MPPPVSTDVPVMNGQHITPRNDPARLHFQELTHLNPRGAVRAQPFLVNGKFPHETGTVEELYKLSSLPPIFTNINNARSSSAAGVAPTRTRERNPDEPVFTGDTIPDEDPDGKRSVEEWKKFRLRVMSRLRKQRWRAKKKAEVLAGIENTKLEEEERLRRDRISKQQQRAKKRQRQLEEERSSSATLNEQASISEQSPSGENLAEGKIEAKAEDRSPETDQ